MVAGEARKSINRKETSNIASEPAFMKGTSAGSIIINILRQGRLVKLNVIEREESVLKDRPVLSRMVRKPVDQHRE